MRHPTNTPIGRFRIETDEETPARCVASLPVSGLANPLTGTQGLGPLAVLVDHVAGLVNHFRRTDDEWTVTSELSLELTPTCAATIADHPDTPVIGTARPVGSRSVTALGECDLAVGATIVGTGTVRSYYVQAPARLAAWPTDDGGEAVKTGLAAIMATGAPYREGAAHVLPQGFDPALNNSIDVIHGGIASAGLEAVASAAVNADRAADPLATASLRVNFLRQFFAGDQSRYVGTALRVGRRSGVADAQAVGSDGKVAIVARLTAYRC
ncbi:PaaI family thioesterase [Mycobacterium antarcticum]|uniref:PaaI family thioesterase n=1 Tax=Mycolicibacterium sp. TUM20984 TaxID=3023368 RepID=UPI002386C57D|nr:PaaI family thioesterase [Mycolicibacterium sp. TUM20984]GLP78845.1 phenylacetic acid degradation protein [Mycolicibacterium sp. TUM20984]